MNSLPCELFLVDHDGEPMWGRDFDSKKEAKEFVREFGLDRAFWVRMAENEAWPDSIQKIELIVSGEKVVDTDWFPKWAKQRE